MNETATVRDLYQEMLDQIGLEQEKSSGWKAWEFCQTWPEKILFGLIGETFDGKRYPQQDIVSMLDQVDDLGEFSVVEWKLFFERVRKDGI